MAARSSPVIACARMSCQIGALGKREVHSIGERLTSISGSMFSPEQIIKLYGCIPMRFLLREALNKDCLCIGFHAALACSFQRSLFAARAHRVACAATPLTSSHTPSGTSATGLFMFGLLDYRDWPHCGLHSPRAERMRENIPVTPSA